MTAYCQAKDLYVHEVWRPLLPILLRDVEKKHRELSCFDRHRHS